VIYSAICLWFLVKCVVIHGKVCISLGNLVLEIKASKLKGRMPESVSYFTIVTSLCLGPNTVGGLMYQPT
jgi:hypothetical protein